MRTDGRTDMTKLIVDFRNLEKAPKMIRACTQYTSSADIFDIAVEGTTELLSYAHPFSANAAMNWNFQSDSDTLNTFRLFVRIEPQENFMF
jgi:hypothetical protein